MTRRGLLLAALLLLPDLAGAQAPPPRRRPRPRRAARPQAAAPAPPPRRNDLAPVPNREIDAPRRIDTATAPRIDPALIDPDEPRYGATGDPHGPQAREDRLLRQPGAGARLRVPFSY